MSLSDNPKARLAQLRERWEAEPGSRIFLQLAEEYRRQGYAEEAASVLESGLQHHPSSIAGFVALGRCQLELGDAEAARDALEGVVSRDPTQMVAYRHLVDAYLALGDPDRARNRLELYVQLNPMDDDIVRLRERIEAAESGPAPSPAEPEELDADASEPEAPAEPVVQEAPVVDPATSVPGEASASPFDSLAVAPPQPTAESHEADKPDWARLLDNSAPSSTEDSSSESTQGESSSDATEPTSAEPIAEVASPAEVPGHPEPAGLPEDFDELPQDDESVRTITAPLSKFDLNLRPPEQAASESVPSAPQPVEAPPPEADGEAASPASTPADPVDALVAESEAEAVDQTTVEESPPAVSETVAEPSHSDNLMPAPSESRNGGPDDNVFVLVPLSLQPLPILSELPTRELRAAAPSIDLTKTVVPVPEDAAALGGEVPVTESQPAGATSTLASLYLEQGHPDEAAELYRDVLSREPDNKLALRGVEAAEQTENPARNVTAAELIDSDEIQGLDTDQRRSAVLRGYLARLKKSHEE